MDSNKTVTASFTSLPPTPPPAALTITTFATGITDPTGITVDPNGNIYTINRVDGVVTMFDPAGNVIKTVTLGGVDLIDIYFDPHTGQLFVGGWVTQTIGNIYERVPQTPFQS
jgi:sugar lactone lactonase YvrE